MSDYDITNTGTNAQGNHYCHREHGDGSSGYHYSNKDGSYHYKNSDGSTHHSDGKGNSKHTYSDGSQVVKSSKSGKSK